MDLINWELAQKVASKISDRVSLPLGYEADEMEKTFERLVPKAEALVNDTTGLVVAAKGDKTKSGNKNARAKVLSRHQWIQANLKSFSRLLKPLEMRLEHKVNNFSQNLGAIQIGVILGWMSTRVLGQYDLLIIEDEDPESQDMVYFVGPNISALEWRHGFNTEDFRLWIALHELTHRAQFTGVPWLREEFLSLVNESLENVDFDREKLSNLVANLKNLKEDTEENKSIAYLLGTEEQIEIFETLGGMMSLLEGHGEVMMDKAAQGQILELDRFHRVIRHRRNNSKGLSSIFQKLLGIETKIRQYEAGEEFVKELQNQGGEEMLNRVWNQPENLPSMQEIHNPNEWIERVNSHVGLKG